MKCDEGCNQAVFQLWNGSEVQTLCEPSFEKAIFELVTQNERVLFYHDGSTDDGLKIIRVG